MISGAPVSCIFVLDLGAILGWPYVARTVKPVLSGHKGLNGKWYSSLMKVENIAECCNTFDQHSEIIGLEKHFLSDRLRQVLL